MSSARTDGTYLLIDRCTDLDGDGELAVLTVRPCNDCFSDLTGPPLQETMNPIIRKACVEACFDAIASLPFGDMIACDGCVSDHLAQLESLFVGQGERTMRPPLLSLALRSNCLQAGAN
jgi:hypothetical protein